MGKKTLRASLAVAVIAVAAALGWWVTQPGGGKPDAVAGSYDIPRQVRFNYAVRNTGNQVVRGAKFFVYAPIHQTGTQRVDAIDSPLVHHVERDALGQQLLVFELPDLPPYGQVDLAYASRLSLTGVPNTGIDQPSQACFQAQSLIESDHPLIQSQAQRLQGENPSASSRNFYRWVADNLAYTGPRGQDRGARHALESGQGDCTDAAFLVVALCRAAGIPARCVGGYVCDRDKNLAASEFHNWAEIWFDGRWHVADPVNRCFDANPETYIVTRIWEAGGAWDAAPFWRHRIEGRNLKVRMTG
ncbi:MAG: transglutaminase-like domain-containing protein [Desulfobacterales bacterium]|nr:transglutaminase-like domain-containing protein [Desulfobacterales bacterium]